jgi:putative nucleotidyltransferase with HDIG domain
LPNIPGSTLQAIESIELPALPRTLLAFMRAVSQDDASMDQVAGLVLREPALAARILSVANSAAFHTAGPLRSVAQSLQVLGVRILRSVAACLAVQQAFGRLPALQPEDLAGFWRHSLFVAELAQAIAAETGQAEPEEAYLCGLLHDIGQLLLLGGLGAGYARILAEAGTEASLPALERRDLQTDHAAVGAWLVERWKLPSFMADAILFHHLDVEAVAQADQLTRTVWAAHAAEALAAQHAPDTEGFEAVAAVVQLQAMPLARLCGSAQANVAQLAAALGVPPSTSALPLWRQPPEAAPLQPQQQDLHDTLASMAALQPLQHELAAADSETQLMAAARESACILFGVRDVVFLLRQGTQPTMCGLPLEGQTALLGRLRIPLEPPARDAAARAALTRSLCSSFTDPAVSGPTVRDLQIARAMDSEGLLCVPMTTGETAWGVMAFPVDRAGAERLERRSAQLLAFAAIVAGHLRSWRALRERNRDEQAAAADGLLLRERQVAHEVGNPLGIIKTYLQIMQRKLPDNLQLDDELQVLREEIDRVARIVRQLGDTPARDATPGRGLIDLNAAVDGLRALYGDPLFGGTGIELVLKLQHPMALTRADRDTVRQVVLNLWKNAAEALPSGSRLSTETVDNLYRDGRAYTQLSVSDDGPGLPTDVMRTPFQPLGIHRRPGRSGLGLSIVHKLVTGLGGQISCQTAAGRGTRFIVLLPQDEGATAAAGGAA